MFKQKWGAAISSSQSIGDSYFYGFLRKSCPGVIKVKGHKGGKYTLTFIADGSVDRTGGIGLDAQTGVWDFDEQNNAYCSAFEEARGYKKVCFAVFRKPHENIFFDYDIEDIFFTHTYGVPENYIRCPFPYLRDMAFRIT